jgi:hypothetical protein
VVDLTPRTGRVIEHFFASEDARREVRRLLETECAETLPFMSTGTSEDLERIRFAVLRESGGDLPRLRRAVEMAKVDWRDLLMGAGFGLQTDAHERWYEDHFGS